MQQQQQQHHHQAPEFSLFVGDLPLNCSDDKLRCLFQQKFKSVKRVQIIRNEDGTSRGFGFIRFEDRAEFQAALSQEMKIGNDRLRLDTAHTKENRFKNNRSRYNSFNSTGNNNSNHHNHHFSSSSNNHHHQHHHNQQHHQSQHGGQHQNPNNNNNKNLQPSDPSPVLGAQQQTVSNEGNALHHSGVVGSTGASSSLGHHHNVHHHHQQQQHHQSQHGGQHQNPNNNNNKNLQPSDPSPTLGAQQQPVPSVANTIHHSGVVGSTGASSNLGHHHPVHHHHHQQQQHSYGPPPFGYMPPPQPNPVIPISAVPPAPPNQASPPGRHSISATTNTGYNTSGQQHHHQQSHAADGSISSMPAGVQAPHQGPPLYYYYPSPLYFDQAGPPAAPLSIYHTQPFHPQFFAMPNPAYMPNAHTFNQHQPQPPTASQSDATVINNQQQPHQQVNIRTRDIDTSIE